MNLTNQLLYKVKQFIALSFLLISCSKGSDSGNNNPPVTTINAEITILGNDNKQTIQGFGCATVFNPPNTSALTNEEFDRLFGSGSGQVGLNILRIRVASDDAWRAVELGYSKAAIQRGARVIGSPWSPPANMKTNNSLIGGSLLPDSGAAYAKYLNDFANFMSANGAPLYAVSVQNEPDVKVTYESCDWTASEMRDFLNNHGSLITSTKLIAPESFNNNQVFVNTILDDVGAAANVDIVGGHIYGGGITENLNAKNKLKDVWMTEHLDEDFSFNGCMNTAIEIHDCLTKANFNAYIWWYGKRFYGPIGQDGIVTQRGYVMSHFARFIRPGSVRVGTVPNTIANVYVSAYKEGSKKVIVAINNTNTNVKQSFKLQDLATSGMTPYTTTSTTNVAQGSNVNLSGSAFDYILPAYSITTFVGQ